VDGSPCIILHAQNQGTAKVWTMFHELGHHFLHDPRICFASDDIISQAEYEANAFACICLVPTMDEFTAKMLERRIEIFREFNL